MQECEEIIKNNDFPTFKNIHNIVKITSCNCRGLTIRYALKNNMMNFIQYMIDNEFMSVTSSNSILFYAAYAFEKSNYDTFKYIHEQLVRRFSPNYIKKCSILTQSLALSQYPDIIIEAINLDYNLKDSIYTLANSDINKSLQLINLVKNYDIDKFLSELNNPSLFYKVYKNINLRKFLIEVDPQIIKQFKCIKNSLYYIRKILKEYEILLSKVDKIPTDICCIIMSYI